MTYGIHALYEPVMEQRNSRTSHSDMFENTARKDGSGQSSPGPAQETLPPWDSRCPGPGFRKAHRPCCCTPRAGDCRSRSSVALNPNFPCRQRGAENRQRGPETMKQTVEDSHTPVLLLLCTLLCI